jgi:hypothetical protein
VVHKGSDKVFPFWLFTLCGVTGSLPVYTSLCLFVPHTPFSQPVNAGHGAIWVEGLDRGGKEKDAKRNKGINVEQRCGYSHFLHVPREEFMCMKCDLQVES